MDDPAQRRILDQIEQPIVTPSPNETMRRRIDAIDGRICRQRALYLKCVWAGHDGEAEVYEFDVDRLLGLRTIVQRGLLTITQMGEVDSL